MTGVEIHLLLIVDNTKKGPFINIHERKDIQKMKCDTFYPFTDPKLGVSKKPKKTSRDAVRFSNLGGQAVMQYIGIICPLGWNRVN